MKYMTIAQLKVRLAEFPDDAVWCTEEERIYIFKVTHNTDIELDDDNYENIGKVECIEE